MRLWESASLVYFVYVTLMFHVASRGGRGRVVRLFAGAGAGLALTGISTWLPHRLILHDVLLPPVLLLVGYWTSGLLFVAPRPAQERFLEALDRRLAIPRAVGRLPRAAAELLELAYLGIYPMVLVACLLHLALVPEPDAERFWMVILVTDYCCFATMPFVQTRPPRALEGGAWRSGVRAVNLGVLGAASVQVNTFPSGHAAEALACVLLLADAPAAVIIPMSVAALGVSAGAVLGRYHYLLDVLAGWVVAIGVWLLVGR